MSGYYGNTRTNYFKVTDEKEFIEIMSKILCSEDSVKYWRKNINEQVYFAFGVNDDILGICDCNYCNKIQNENDEYECENEYSYDKMCNSLQKVLHPEDAIIITSNSYERLNFVGGCSTIISKNEIKYIDFWTHSINVAKEVLKNDNYDTEYSY